MIYWNEIISLSEIFKNPCKDEYKFEIRIFATKSVIVDMDINIPTSLTIVAPTFDIRDEFTINLNGNDGQDGINGEDGNAKVARNVTPPVKGDDGQPGSPGKAGGNFVGLFGTIENVEKLKITSNGGKGGNGGDGGAGNLIIYPLGGISLLALL